LIAKRGVIVFVRKPELGKVKTRLAESVGPQKALDIYKALLLHTRNVVENVDTKRFVFYHESIDYSDEWAAEKFSKKKQVDGNLGEKLQDAFDVCFKTCNQVVVIGSDCASLHPSHIETAFSFLQKSDTVIGPTYDGGYYLLGMNKYNPSLFQGINWSTETVFDETVSAITENNLTYTTLDKLSDIDYLEDWKKWGWEL